MRIVTLIENSPGREGCSFEHGLSLYIETARHHVLMDTGASDAFIANAQRLGVDLRSVDTVVLSHGHYDHTGGVLSFARMNPEADIYLHGKADGAFYHGDRYIGIDREILSLPRLRLTDGELRVDDELFLFSGIRGKRHRPESNLELLRRDGDGHDRPDDFGHEQCLAVFDGGKRVLLSGCAHNGILNILDRYRELFHADPDTVISGFHMMKKTAYTGGELRTIREIAMELKEMNTVFYTGHCTGAEAYALMKEIMGDKLRPIRSGDELPV